MSPVNLAFCSGIPAPCEAPPANACGSCQPRVRGEGSPPVPRPPERPKVITDEKAARRPPISLLQGSLTQSSERIGQAFLRSLGALRSASTSLPRWVSYYRPRLLARGTNASYHPSLGALRGALADPALPVNLLSQILVGTADAGRGWRVGSLHDPVMSSG